MEKKLLFKIIKIFLTIISITVIGHLWCYLDLWIAFYARCCSNVRRMYWPDKSAGYASYTESRVSEVLKPISTEFIRLTTLWRHNHDRYTRRTGETTFSDTSIICIISLIVQA